ncbi:MAG: glycogen/starch synthase [Ignavibacteria bacterium]|nr:glycogen/starch synthase [Ignavibacteria bacterium]
MKVCFITSECAPFVKTGGLADVSGSLPEALTSNGVNVKVFLPLYDVVDTKKFGIVKLVDFPPAFVEIGDEKREFCIHSYKKNENLEFHFVDCPYYFGRGIVYTNDKDENERFIMFQHAVLKSLQYLQWQPDILHCNDWQSSYIPAMLKLQYSWDKLFENSKTILSIHNIGYQGIFEPDTVRKAGFGDSCFVLGGPFEFNGNANFLKTGIFYSDVVSTVSPKYAEEITTSEFGSGLDGVLRARKDNIRGILNGIDTIEWNPLTDKLIPKNYSYKNPEDKKYNKEKLLQKAGFDDETDIPLYGIVTRLAWQKGIELIIELCEKTKSENFRLIVLGSGEKEYEEKLTALSIENPGKIKVFLGYNNEFAHLITAGSDFFFMPSRYEPCGLNQMYSLNYGTVPIVREVGGLADTVTDISNEKEGNGITFRDFVYEEFEQAFHRSRKLFEDTKQMEKVIQRGMKNDFSWEKSAGEYLRLYESLKQN